MRGGGDAGCGDGLEGRRDARGLVTVDKGASRSCFSTGRSSGTDLIVVCGTLSAGANSCWTKPPLFGHSSPPKMRSMMHGATRRSEIIEYIIFSSLYKIYAARQQSLRRRAKRTQHSPIFCFCVSLMKKIKRLCEGEFATTTL